MSFFAPRDYADKLAYAMGEGADAETAKAYAGGARPLRDFIGEDECDHAELDAGSRPDRVRNVRIAPDRAAWIERITEQLKRSRRAARFPRSSSP